MQAQTVDRRHFRTVQKRRTAARARLPRFPRPVDSRNTVSVFDIDVSLARFLPGMAFGVGALAVAWLAIAVLSLID